MKTNYEGKNKKTKKEIRTYKKTFQSFSDGVEELKKISTVAVDIIGNAKNTPEEVSMAMFNAIADNFPTISNNGNVFWSINISTNRCIIKTDKKLSFGWKMKYDYDRETRTNSIFDIEFIITDFGCSNEISEKALRSGWSVESF